MQTLTTTLLLERLHDQSDNEIWEEFDGRYRPVLIGIGIRLGLNQDEAAEAAQETLVQFMRDYRNHKYNTDHGRLRSWLVGICRNRIMDAHRGRKKLEGARGDSIISKLPNEDQMKMTWDAEQQRVIYQTAMRQLLSGGRINPRTTEVFELVALKNVPAKSVAEQFDIEVSEVYRIKNRVTLRLREIVDELTQAYNTGM